jgi:hypothetical protein
MMHHQTLKTLIPRRRSPAVVGTLSPGYQFAGRPSTKFKGKYLKSGEPVELDSFEHSLNFVLSSISLRQCAGPHGQPSWIISAVGIPIQEIGYMFTEDAAEADLCRCFVSIWTPEKADAGVSAKFFVSDNLDHVALHVYKTPEQIASLVELITSGCRVLLSVEIEAVVLRLH